MIRLLEDESNILVAQSIRKEGAMGHSTDVGSSNPAGENFARFVASLGVSIEQVVSAGQVHGEEIAVLAARPEKMRFQDTDALATNQKNLALSIRGQDCFLGVVYHPYGAIGLCHLGWRGVKSGLLLKTIEAVAGLARGDVNDARVEIGPGIQSCCFEMKDDEAGVRNFAAYKDIRGCILERDGKSFVDLPLILCEQMRRVGFHADRLRISRECTAHPTNSTRYFSWRRDGKTNGGNMVLIAVLL